MTAIPTERDSLIAMLDRCHIPYQTFENEVEIGGHIGPGSETFTPQWGAITTFRFDKEGNLINLELSTGE